MGLEQVVENAANICLMCFHFESTKLVIVLLKYKVLILQESVKIPDAVQDELIPISCLAGHQDSSRFASKCTTQEYGGSLKKSKRTMLLERNVCMKLREKKGISTKNLMTCFFTSTDIRLNVYYENLTYYAYKSKSTIEVTSASPADCNSCVRDRNRYDILRCPKSMNGHFNHVLVCQGTEHRAHALSPKFSSIQKRIKDALTPSPTKQDSHGVKDQVPKGQDTRLVQTPSSLMFAVLGWSGNAPTVTIEVYDPLARKWFYLAQNTFIKRAYHGVVMSGILIYVIGGFDGRRCHSTTYCFNVHKRHWYRRPDMRCPRCYVTALECRGMVYAVGGFDGDERFRSCEKFDPRSRRWEYVASMHERRSDASGTEHGGKMFVCGGFNGMQVLSSAEMYNPDCDQWSFISNMLSPRSGLSLVSHQGGLLAIGGYDGRVRLRTVEEYDESGGCWMDRPPMLSPRSNFASAVVMEELHVIGGYNGETTFPDVERYDNTRKMWAPGRNLNKHRSAHGACVFSDSMMLSMCSTPGHVVIQAVNVDQRSP